MNTTIIKNPKILNTTDYKIFRGVKSNRDIDKNLLLKLTNSIKARNLLHLFPIIVNSEMEIIEGQHRHRAAQALEVPLYYIVDDEVNRADMAMVNNNRKGWNSKDYIKFWTEEAAPGYKQLQSLLATYPLTIIGAARLISRGNYNYFGGGELSRNLRLGALDYSDYKLAKSMCEEMTKLKTHIPYCYKPWFILELKYVLHKNNTPDAPFVKQIIKLKSMFPQSSTHNDPAIPKLLRTIFWEERKGFTQEEVSKIFEQHNVDQKANQEQ